VRVSSVSVAIPAYNEEQNLAKVVRDLAGQLTGHDYEIIIVNDGSKDGTGPLADRLAQEDPQHIRVIHHPTNLGGGAATRAGLFAAKKKYVMMVPGDGQFAVADLPRFLEAIEHVDVVISRRHNRSGGLLRRFNSFCYRMAVRFILGIKFKHINWVKLYRSELVQSLHLISDSWLVDAEILYWADRLGWRYTEFTVEELPRLAGKATGSNLLHMLAVVGELWRFHTRLRQHQQTQPPVRVESGTAAHKIPFV
jgi:dolichol-phosphate mannosyltransferase